MANKLENHLNSFEDAMIAVIPESVIEWRIIRKISSDTKKRSPGKYNILLYTIDTLSNFNPTIRGILPGEGAFPAVEPAYIWGRLMDDMADGDIAIPHPYTDFPQLAASYQELIKSGAANVPKGLTYEFLTKRMLQKLERAKTKNDNVRDELCNFLDAMVFDYERRQQKKVLSKKELIQQYHDSFGPPVSIILIALGSKTRYQDITEIGEAQGRIYALADLEIDLRKNICNIPQEVIHKSGFTADEIMDHPLLVKTNPVLQQWQTEELEAVRKLVEALEVKYSKMDWKSKVLCKGLLKGATRWFK